MAAWPGAGGPGGRELGPLWHSAPPPPPAPAPGRLHPGLPGFSCCARGPWPARQAPEAWPESTPLAPGLLARAQPLLTPGRRRAGTPLVPARSPRTLVPAQRPVPSSRGSVGLTCPGSCGKQRSPFGFRAALLSPVSALWREPGHSCPPGFEGQVHHSRPGQPASRPGASVPPWGGGAGGPAC